MPEPADRPSCLARRTFLAGVGVAAWPWAPPAPAAQRPPAAVVPEVPPAIARAFNEPVDRSMIDWLNLPSASRVLDAGCGRGDHLHQFARVVDEGIVGLDIAATALATARRELAEAPRARRITLRQGDVNALPFADRAFTLSWASHLLHFQPDPVASARELARVTAPGGRVVIRENFSLRVMLPRDPGVGRPGLESRLGAAFDAWFEEDRLARGRVPFGWRAVLARAGMLGVRTRSFLHEVEAPFTADQRRVLHAQLARRDSDRLTDDDRRTLAGLLDEQGPDFFLNRIDVHFVAVSTLYVGTVPEERA